MSDDLAAYLDSWADLLAANVERRVASGAEQARADATLLQEAIAETRAVLLAALRDGLGRLDQGVAATRQDLERTGGEVARANATLGALQDAMASLRQAVERVPQAINTALNRDLASDLAAARQELEASEFATLDDMLALLDSVEVELDAGRQLLLTLSTGPREAQASSSAGLQGAMAGAWRSLGKGLGVTESDGAQPATPLLPVDGIQRLVDGIETTHRRLLDALSRRGVTPIEAAGARFDPSFHEAVAFEPCPPAQDGVVLREQRRGYRTDDAVVRLAHVVVGRADR